MELNQTIWRLCLIIILTSSTTLMISYGFHVIPLLQETEYWQQSVKIAFAASCITAISAGAFLSMPKLAEIYNHLIEKHYTESVS